MPRSLPTLTHDRPGGRFTPSYHTRRPIVWECVKCKTQSFDPGLYCVLCRAEIVLRP